MTGRIEGGIRKRLRQSSVLLAATAALSALSISAAPTASAQCMDYGMGYRNFTIQLDGVSNEPYWGGILNQAISNWNNSGAGTSLRNSQSMGKFTASRFGTSNNGLYTPKGVNSLYGTKYVDRYFLIQINAEAIEKWAPKSVKPDFGHWNRESYS